MPKIVTVKLKSTAPYLPGRMHLTPRLHNEKDNDYEARTWREKCSVDDNGEIVIPMTTFQAILKPFKGKVICRSDIRTGWKKADVPNITIFALTA